MPWHSPTGRRSASRKSASKARKPGCNSPGAPGLPDPAFRISGQQYNAASQALSEVDVGITFTVPWLNAGKYRAQTGRRARG